MSSIEVPTETLNMPEPIHHGIHHGIHRRIHSPACRIALLALCLLLLASMHARAATVVYIDQPHARAATQRQIATAAGFYGLDLRSITLDGNAAAADAAISDPHSVAVVINAASLPALSSAHVFALLHRRSQSVPLLIAGIHEGTAPALLKEWSAGTVIGYRQTSGAGQYQVADVSGLTRQLSDSTLPLTESSVLSLDTTGTAQPIVNAVLGDNAYPVFVRTAVAGQSVFFATEQTPAPIPLSADPYRQQRIFASIAAPMLFLRYAGGDRVWHSPGDYANFTIDDLWLREPYGHVNYQALLDQAEQHNFHATVAFIPWNFDRSQPGVVALFRANPERLSICIHGDNHIHQEFGPFAEHPLKLQVADMDQGLARMARFHQLTGLPYDAVMVFPHSISPQATFAALKHANYLGTANSLNVPTDAAVPTNAEFALRTATLDFATFPSLRRYSAETDIPHPQLAIDAFLGNPMLFYAHESFFATGIDAFNPTADFVNQVQPNTKWTSLGDIMHHLYLERLRDDGNLDVRALSASIQIKNDLPHDATVSVEKAEDFSTPLTVLVDGRPYSFQHAGNTLRLELPIAAGKTRSVEVRYLPELNLAAIDISKPSIKVAIIRQLSDFRDNFVSDTRAGRWFIHSYVDYRSDWNRAIAIMVLFIALFLAAWYLHHKKEPSHRADLRLPGQNSRANETDLR